MENPNEKQLAQAASCGFVPDTDSEQQDMLHEAGYQSFDELYADVPESVKLHGRLDLPEGMSEMEALGKMQDIAAKNRIYRTILRGAGAYDHYIPAIVKRVVSKETLQTAYTPYQAEISQGVLQSIFEYQTMICQLTGMDVANASVYDGATAAAEAVHMCVERRRTVIYMSETLPPEVKKVVRTYCFGRNADLREIPEKDGVTDIDAMKGALDDSAACVLFAQPNYYGNLEPAQEITDAAHEAGAKVIMSCEPTSLALLKTPAEYGADIAVGEGQPLGMPLAWGGPYLGYMASTKALMRRLPGRIVGETVDTNGKRAFVLTLQAREQHIKREKASSNICSNEALCALTASVYLAAVGPDGLREVADQSTSKAHYLQKKLAEAGLAPAWDRPYFAEFVTVCEEKKAEALLAALDEKGILGGLPLGGGRILWCCTEKNARAQLDEAAEIVKEVLA